MADEFFILQVQRIIVRRGNVGERIDVRQAAVLGFVALQRCLRLFLRFVKKELESID